ncbi:MAG TPA: SCO family protein [Polyangiaceae bacterium]|nr:SCO family protein [Polyangiaceae bacterium]
MWSSCIERVAPLAAAVRAAAAFALSLAALCGCAWPEEDLRRVSSAPTSAPLFDGRGAWTDEAGQAVSPDRYGAAGPLVVSAIYTRCTLRCPLTIDKLRELDASLRAEGVAADFVLVTLDPDGDDAARLRDFKDVRNLPAAWHLLRGGATETREFARRLGLRTIRDGGHIDHDVAILVLAARGRLAYICRGWDCGPQDLARALAASERHAITSVDRR